MRLHIKWLIVPFGPNKIWFWKPFKLRWTWKMSHLMTKPTKWSVRPAKTQICPVWSEYSLSAWRKLGSLATRWAHSKDWSDWADAQADLSLHWAHVILLVLSWGGSDSSQNNFIESLVCSWVPWYHTSLLSFFPYFIYIFHGHSMKNTLNRDRARQNQQNDLCIQRRLRSAWASTQSDQSFCCLYEETLDP